MRRITNTYDTDFADNLNGIPVYTPVITGTSEDEIIEGSRHSDTIFGGAGNDIILGYDGGDWMDGEAGDDTLMGGAGVDFMYGREGNNIYVGGTGIDFIFGGPDNDTYLWDIGDDNDIVLQDALGLNILQFGVGITSNDVRFFKGVHTDLEVVIFNEHIALTNYFSKDYPSIILLEFNDGTVLDFAAVANLLEVAPNDFIEGFTYPPNILRGFDGNDVLLGVSANDILIGGSGADVLSGGEGIDRAAYWDATEGVRVNLNYTLNNTGDAKGDTYYSIEEIQGSFFDDVLIGNAEDNGVFGDAGNDKIYGAGGNDTMIGGAGNDAVYGNAGNDWIDGGIGIDYLVGGAGNDRFILKGTNLGFNTVADFTSGEDKIFIYGSTGITSFAELELALSDHISGDALITFADGGKTLLVGVDQDDLSITDFAFI